MPEDSEILLNPDPGRWGGLLRGRANEAPPEAAQRRSFREQAGLPSDGPVVLAGHQASFLHAGIVAKHFAGGAVARKAGATAAWLWVDQDENDPAHVPYPTASLGRGVWDLAAGRVEPRGVPTGARAPLGAVGEAPADVHPAVHAPGLEAMRRGLTAHASAPSLAQQVASVVADLLGAVEPLGVQVSALGLGRTELFGELLERMIDDPRRCVAAYNEAAAAHASAGIRPLSLREGRVELPLWRVRRGEPRLGVYSTTVLETPREELAPRALLMDALVRWAGCELFVHGTGGGAYAPMSGEWFERWLGERLAPVAIASATLRLPLAGGELPGEAEIRDAQDAAHKARHDPAIIGDERAAREKRELVERIARAKAAGEDPAPLFEDMHGLLERYRQRHASELQGLDERARVLAQQRGAAEVASERTWALAMHEPARLADLRRRIESAFAGAA